MLAARLVTYRKLAGIEKHGCVHVFGRHSIGSLLVKRGCDIVTIKELTRHSDAHTTKRYLHVSDATKRAKHEQFLQPRLEEPSLLGTPN